MRKANARRFSDFNWIPIKLNIQRQNRKILLIVWNAKLNSLLALSRSPHSTTLDIYRKTLLVVVLPLSQLSSIVCIWCFRLNKTSKFSRKFQFFHSFERSGEFSLKRRVEQQLRWESKVSRILCFFHRTGEKTEKNLKTIFELCVVCCCWASFLSTSQWLFPQQSNDLMSLYSSFREGTIKNSNVKHRQSRGENAFGIIEK